MKFFGVGELFGNIVVVWVAMRMVRLRGAWRATALVVLLLSCWSGALWLVRHGPKQSWAVAPERGEGQGEAAEDFARAYGAAIGARERVFALDNRLTRTGFLLPGTDWQSHRDLRALLLDRPALKQLKSPPLVVH